MDLGNPSEIDQRILALLTLIGDLADLLTIRGVATEEEIIARLENLEEKAMPVGWPALSETLHLATMARVEREALYRHPGDDG